ncbi:MAG: ribonuclease H-like domain-containing protein [Candidatus Aenigmarchaeota archaeon]|nr:ribonuclease H-like domain-containing protein [Candidatus Aenigmarchaeota archaeon]
MKFQILDIDYFLNNNKPVLRIFGKQEDGTSVCGMYDKLEPYFYIRLGVSFDKALDEMEKMREIKNVEQAERFVPLGYQTSKTKLLKVTLWNPQEVPTVKSKLIELGIAKDIFEADILFKYRFMIDHGFYGMQWVEADGESTKTVKSKVKTYKINSIKPIEKQENAPISYMAFDIECVPSDPKRPLDARKDPIVMISLSFVPEYRNKKDIVLVAKPFTGEGTKGFANEKEMLEEFLNIIETYDPDVLTGYNINSFDFPYIVERLKQNKLNACIGRTDKEAFSREFGITNEFIVTGRVVVDPYQILKRDPWVKFHRYDLNTVAKQLLNEEKHAVEYGEMAGLWNGGKEGLSRLIEYCRRDADLSLKLVLNRGMLDKFFELSKISGLLLQDVFGGQTRRIEVMLLHEFRKRDFVMSAAPSRNDMSRRTGERKDNELKGATVLEPKKGLHAEGCVLVLDFKSLYPSIMRTFNVSPDSVLLDKELIEKVKSHQSPTGTHFVDGEIYQGIFPFVLTKLLDARGAIKKQMKTSAGDEKRILNAKQLALKDICNSFYGYTGYIRARLYMIDVANSITGYGRDNIEKTRKLIEENFDVEVVYGDTDSIFLKTKTTNLEEAQELGTKISKFITERLPGYLELEFEKIYRTFLILSKKRYAGWKFEKVGDKWNDEMEMRGIETVRRDWCMLVSDVMNEVLRIVLKEGDLQAAITCVKDILDKLRKGKIPMEKLTIIKGITQSLDAYKGTLPHIELAKKLAIRNPHDPPKVGDRLEFVIIKGNQMLSKRSEDPRYAEQNNIQIDSDYYINSQLFPPIERIFAAVGIDKSEIFGSGHQASLGDLLSGKKRTMKHDIEIEYKKLEGIEEFICKKCNKSYRRIPLSGVCECGGELLMSYHGSVGDKIILDKK